jgi:hypothetical protein
MWGLCIQPLNDTPSEKGKSFWFFFLKQAGVVWQEQGVSLSEL